LEFSFSLEIFHSHLEVFGKTQIFHEVHDEQLRSGMAGAIVNRVRVWRNGGNVVMLEQFSGKITSSALR